MPQNHQKKDIIKNTVLKILKNHWGHSKMMSPQKWYFLDPLSLCRHLRLFSLTPFLNITAQKLKNISVGRQTRNKFWYLYDA